MIFDFLRPKPILELRDHESTELLVTLDHRGRVKVAPGVVFKRATDRFAYHLMHLGESAYYTKRGKLLFKVNVIIGTFELAEGYKPDPATREFLRVVAHLTTGVAI